MTLTSHKCGTIFASTIDLFHTSNSVVLELFTQGLVSHFFSPHEVRPSDRGVDYKTYHRKNFESSKFRK